MLTELFYNLKKAQIPVSVTEYLTLLGAMEQHLAGYSIDSFYYLARASLIKDERFFDRFDQIFSDYIKGKESIFDEVIGEIPLEWLQKQKELRLLQQEEFARKDVEL